jgi:hypothetical protein
MEATPTKLKVIVPYGVETNTVSVRTALGEGISASVLPIRTSISGSVESTNRQPLSNVTVRLLGVTPPVSHEYQNRRLVCFAGCGRRFHTWSR